jgi:hypothetical protein
MKNTLADEASATLAEDDPAGEDLSVNGAKIRIALEK